MTGLDIEYPHKKTPGARPSGTAASGVFDMLSLNFISHPKNGLNVAGVLGVRLQLVPQAPNDIIHGVGA